MGDFELLLASNSPRRRELLALTGWKFRVRPAEVDEAQITGEKPGHFVLRLAKAKAQACAGSCNPGMIIVGADTVVVDRDVILGKPKDLVDAKNMLVRLRGRTHQVFTGIAVMKKSIGHLVTELCITDVPMRAYSDKEMDSYIASGDPLDKAGGYAIQNPFFHPVESLSGCYASVMGLPLCHLTRSLQKIRVTPKTDIPAECQSSLGYTCPIFTAVLRGDQVG